MTNAINQKAPQIDSVVTSLSVVEVLADAVGPMRVKDIAESLSISPPRVHRHLNTLKLLGYVEQETGSERYFLTAKLLHLGQSVAKQSDFLSISRRTLPLLLQRSGLAVSVGAIETEGVRILDIYRQKTSIEITTWPGTLFSFEKSAQGLVALAFGFKECNQMLLENIQVNTAKSLLEYDSLLKNKLEMIKKQGWADAPGEVLVGINAVAAPVFDQNGLIGTVSMIGDLDQLPSPPSSDQLELIKDTAASISWQLGSEQKGRV